VLSTLAEGCLSVAISCARLCKCLGSHGLCHYRSSPISWLRVSQYVCSASSANPVPPSQCVAVIYCGGMCSYSWILERERFATHVEWQPMLNASPKTYEVAMSLHADNRGRLIAAMKVRIAPRCLRYDSPFPPPWLSLPPLPQQ
jgi:hypothetical protein